MGFLFLFFETNEGDLAALRENKVQDPSQLWPGQRKKKRIKKKKSEEQRKQQKKRNVRKEA
jgi:hypothetical protein